MGQEACITGKGPGKRPEEKPGGTPMSKYYDEALLPSELRRNFNVYDRLTTLSIALGTFEENVVSLANANIAGAVIHESGLVYLSGTTGGTYPMTDDEERVQHGHDGARQHRGTTEKGLECYTNRARRSSARTN
jgi:hypothetical protein